jgi:hypothetical protein
MATSDRARLPDNPHFHVTQCSTERMPARCHTPAATTSAVSPCLVRMALRAAQRSGHLDQALARRSRVGPVAAYALVELGTTVERVVAGAAP